MSIYIGVLFAVLHPHVRPEYKAYYIDHISSDWNPSYYPGTLEQGMNFSRRGLPEWVKSTRGLSIRESWGRWTDEDLGPIAGLKFTQSFSGPLCVDFTARAVPWVVGRTITVEMGNEKHPLRIAAEDLTAYEVQFTNLQQANELNIDLPKSLPRVFEMVPTNGDPRRLALNLSTLRLIPGRCPAVSASAGASH